MSSFSSLFIKITICFLSISYLFPLTAQDSDVYGNCGRKVFDEIDNDDPIISDSYVKQRGLWVKNIHWKAGDTIPVYFLNGTKETKALIKHYAREWEKYGNFKFHFHKGRKTGNAQSINIHIQAPHERRQGICGTALLGAGFTDNRPAMRLECLDSRVILHEFGHSLGLYHEQNNPNIRNFLNREEAYRFFQNSYGYSRKFLDDNIFNLKTSKRYDWSEFDKSSIMIYTIPGNVFLDGKPSLRNVFLSKGDHATIRRIYPGKQNVDDSEMITLINDDLTFNYTIRDQARIRVLIDGRAVLDTSTPVEARSFSLAPYLSKTKPVRLKFTAERFGKYGVVMIRDILDKKLENDEILFPIRHLDCHNNFCNTSKSNDIKSEREFLVKLLDPEDYYTGYIPPQVTQQAPPSTVTINTNNEVQSDTEWSGRYNCGVYGFLTLEKPNVNSLKGSYTYLDGSVTGSLSGKDQNTYTGNWQQRGDNSRGKFEFKKQNKLLVGRWTSGNSNKWYGGWNCSK
jgi:serralysin